MENVFLSLKTVNHLRINHITSWVAAAASTPFTILRSDEAVTRFCWLRPPGTDSEPIGCFLRESITCGQRTHRRPQKNPRP